VDLSWLIALIVVLLMWFVLFKTSFGLRVRWVGQNISASVYAGGYQINSLLLHNLLTKPITGYGPFSKFSSFLRASVFASFFLPLVSKVYINVWVGSRVIKLHIDAVEIPMSLSFLWTSTFSNPTPYSGVSISFAYVD